MMMMLRNNVSAAPPYIDDIQSGAEEELVRVGYV
jgi:hypothetical protein